MIDLHTHTVHSDGTDTVPELLQKAEETQIEILSITDHDKIDAYIELEQHPEWRKLFSGKIIVGAEIKGIYKHQNIEVLGYGVNYHKLQIHQVNHEFVQKETFEHMKSVALNAGLKIDEDVSFQDELYANVVIAKQLLKYPENKKRLEQLGEKEFIPTTFYRTAESNMDSIFYVDTSKYYPTIEQVIDDIHEAGGIAFLAHGYIYPFKNSNLELENIVANTKIDGLECIYPLFSQEQTLYIKELCEKYNKFLSRRNRLSCKT